MTYAPELSADEITRYRVMADKARYQERELWKRAGLRAGARVADLGCGPGAMLMVLAELEPDQTRCTRAISAARLLISSFR